MNPEEIQVRTRDQEKRRKSEVMLEKERPRRAFEKWEKNYDGKENNANRATPYIDTEENEF